MLKDKRDGTSFSARFIFGFKAASTSIRSSFSYRSQERVIQNTMSKLTTLLCLICFGAVNSAVTSDTNTQERLQEIKDGLAEFEEIHEVILHNMTQGEKHVNDFVDGFVKRLKDNLKLESASAKSSYKGFNVLNCEHFLDVMTDTENLESDIRRCGILQIEEAHSCLERKKIEEHQEIIDDYIYHAETCEGEECGQYDHHVLHFIDAAVSSLKQDFLECYELLEHTEHVDECIHKESHIGMLPGQKRYYLHAFKDCMSHEISNAKASKKIV